MNTDGAVVDWLCNSIASADSQENDESCIESQKGNDASLNEGSSFNTQLIEILRVPAIYILRDRTVVNSNQTAKELFRVGDMLRCTRGVLSTAGQQEDVDLRSFLTTAFDKGDGDKLWSYTLEIRETGRYCQCFAVFIDSRDINDSDKSDAVLVFIADPEQSVNIPYPILRSLFNLTRCEARIAVALLNGTSVEQYSEMANISQNTVRTHLKAIFQKTYTSSQPNLVSLLSRLVPIMEIGE